MADSPDPLESLEDLFDRFRRSGDSAALAEVFDRAAPVLQRLAVHLAQSVSNAEDLLQATFVSAIESRAGYDPARPLLPWLTGILAMHARRERRAAARSIDGARLATRTVLEPAAQAECAELDAHVTRSLDGLPDPYRAVLVLHVVHGLNGAEIAHALGRAPATVRSQIARGLALLRQALPAGIAGSALVAGRGLAAVRVEVMRHAASTVATVSIASAVATAGGALLMKKTLVLTFALVAFGLLSLLAWSELLHPSESSTTQLDGSLVAAADASGSHDVAGEASPTRRDVPRAAERSTPAAELGAIEALVRWDDGTPAAHRGIAVHDVARDPQRLYVHRVTTAADGSATIARLLPGMHRVGSESVEVVAGATARVTLIHERWAEVEGVVLDAKRQPVAGASIWQSDGTDYRAGFVVAESDASGKFTIPIGPTCYVGARKRGLAPSRLREVTLLRGERTTLELELGARGATLTGSVCDPGGQPIERALVDVTSFRSGVSISEHGKRSCVAPGGRTLTGTNGTFSFDDVFLERARVTVRAPGFAVWQREVTFRSGESVQLDARLGRGVQVHGRVVDASGQPVAGATIDNGDAWTVARAVTESAQDGLYLLDDLRPEPTMLYARRSGIGEASRHIDAGAGAALTWNPVLASKLSIRGHVLDEHGQPLERYEVTAWPEDLFGTVASARTDAFGKFVLQPVEPRPYRIEVRSSHSAPTAFPLIARSRVVPPTASLELRVTADHVPSAFVSGTLVGPEGLRLTGIRVLASRGNRAAAPGLQVDPESGRFRLGPLPPGEVRLTLEAQSYPTTELGSYELHAHQTLDLGTRRLVAPGTLSVTPAEAHRATVALAELANFAIQSAGGRSVASGSFAGGAIQGLALAPGRYLLRPYLFANGATPLPGFWAQPFEILPGKETRLELSASPAVTRELCLAAASGEMPGGSIAVCVRDLAGRLVDTNATQAVGETLACTLVLPPGRYVIEARAEDGRSGRVEADMPGDGAKPIRLALR